MVTYKIAMLEVSYFVCNYGLRHVCLLCVIKRVSTSVTFHKFFLQCKTRTVRISRSSLNVVTASARHCGGLDHVCGVDGDRTAAD